MFCLFAFVFAISICTDESTRTIQIHGAYSSGNQARSRRSDSSTKKCTKTAYLQGYPCGGDSFHELASHNTCVYFASQQSNWKDARGYCHGLDADFVVIPNKTFDDALTALPPSRHKMARWIGLHRDQEGGGFRWLDSTEKFTYFNWGSGSPGASSTGQDCVMRDGSRSGSWDDVDCKTKLGFICQRYSERSHVLPPRLWIKGHETTEVFDGGVTLDMGCDIYDKASSNLHIYMQTDKGVGMVHQGGKGTYGLPVVYEIYSKRCRPRWTMGYKVRVNQSFDGAKLRCCFRKGANEYCGASRSVAVKHQPRMPEVNINFHYGDNVLFPVKSLTATCGAYVGDDGQLAWIVNFGKTQQIEQITREGTFPYAVEGSFVIIYHLPTRHTTDDYLGPHMNSSIRVTVTKRLQNATLICISAERKFRINSQNYREFKLLQESPKIIVLDPIPPEPPQLSVSYHEEPSTVYHMGEMLASCSALVGVNGSLVWSLDGKNVPGRMEWSLSAWEGAVDRLPENNIATLTHAVTHDKRRGPLVSSKFGIIVTYHLDKAKLSCRSELKPLHLSIPFVGDIDRKSLMRSSLPLRIKYEPGKANLTTQYKYTGPDLSRGHTWLEANCSAHVGSDGYLFWVLESDQGVKSLRMDTANDISYSYWPNGPEFKISVFQNLLDPRQGPSITSTLKLPLHPDLEGATLACLPSATAGNFTDFGHEETRSEVRIDAEGNAFSPLNRIKKMQQQSRSWSLPSWEYILAAAVLVAALGIVAGCRLSRSMDTEDDDADTNTPVTEISHNSEGNDPGYSAVSSMFEAAPTATSEFDSAVDSEVESAVDGKEESTYASHF